MASADWPTPLLSWKAAQKSVLGRTFAFDRTFLALLKCPSLPQSTKDEKLQALAICKITTAENLRALPPSVVVPAFLRLGKMQIEVHAALTNPRVNGNMRERAVLPRRCGGLALGISPVVPAVFLWT